MEQDQSVSGTKMLIWSIFVIVGIIFLAAFTRPPSIKTAESIDYQGRRMGLMHSPVEVAAVKRSSEISIQMNFSNHAKLQRPGFACPKPCDTPPLLSQLTTSNKSLVITFGSL